MAGSTLSVMVSESRSLGQGELYQDPVDSGIVVELVDDRLEVHPAGVCRQLMVDAGNADLFGVTSLVAYIEMRRRVVAHQPVASPGCTPRARSAATRLVTSALTWLATGRPSRMAAVMFRLPSREPAGAVIRLNGESADCR